jgi:hypothetical protein
MIGSFQPQSDIINRQGAKNAKSEVAHWEETNRTHDGPMNGDSRPSMEKSEFLILGDIGVMAVQGLSRS